MQSSPEPALTIHNGRVIEFPWLLCLFRSCLHCISCLPLPTVCTSRSHSPFSFLMASFSATAEYKCCRFCLVSPHLKTLLSGHVKGYGTPIQHQSNFSHVWDEITVYLDSSYVKALSLCGNYFANSPLEIPFIHQCLVNGW